MEPTPISKIIESESPGFPSTFRIVDDRGFTVAVIYARGSTAESLANAQAYAVAGEALLALEFVKDFFQKIEDGCPADDPLTAIRRKHHAPVHRVIDSVLNKKVPLEK